MQAKTFISVLPMVMPTIARSNLSKEMAFKRVPRVVPMTGADQTLETVEDWTLVQWVPLRDVA